jgi:hypothetical protein
MISLDIQAGRKAIEHIRQHGLNPQDITIVPGAAGGPKGLGLAKLDEWLFAEWLPQGFASRSTPIDLIGASIGAWRFGAVCRGTRAGKFSPDETRAALAAFASAYSQQKYPRKVSAAYITAYARDLINNLFEGHIADVLTHPHYRLHVLAVRGKNILAREQRGRTQAGFALAALANAAGRKHLRHFLDRTWFYAGDDATPLFADEILARGGQFDPFRTAYSRLTESNFGDALIASGSIPLILDGVRNIDGAAEGTYWDGGIIDYHLHLPYARRKGLVLYPHFTNKIVPGWLDKMLPWRSARGGRGAAEGWLDNVVLVSPSREYLDRLPMKKLPDRSDFTRFVDDYEGRLKNWRFAMEESARLRDELAGLIQSGDIISRLKPL